MKKRNKTELAYLKQVKLLRSKRRDLEAEFTLPWRLLRKHFTDWDVEFLVAIWEQRLLAVRKPLRDILRVLYESSRYKEDDLPRKWDALVVRIVDLQKRMIGLRVARKLMRSADDTTNENRSSDGE